MRPGAFAAMWDHHDSCLRLMKKTRMGLSQASGAAAVILCLQSRIGMVGLVALHLPRMMHCFARLAWQVNAA